MEGSHEAIRRAASLRVLLCHRVVTRILKLVLKAQKATLVPMGGPAMVYKGHNNVGFFNDYNGGTADKDKSYIFVLKTPPPSVLLLKDAGLLLLNATLRDVMAILAKQPELVRHSIAENGEYICKR